MEIIRTTPSYITAKLGERVDGSPDFVIDARALTFWEPPFDLIPIAEAERASIIEFVITTLRARGWDISAE